MGDRVENLLGALALAVSDSFSSAVETAAGHPGSMAAALAVLAQEPGLGIEQLKRQLSLTQSATVRVVDQLAAEGRAERQAGHDHRSISVVLTEQGTAVAARVLDARSAVLREALAVLDADERTVLAAVLEKVLGAVTRDRVHAEQICRLCDLGACPLPACPVDCAAVAEPRPATRPQPRPIPERYRGNASRPATRLREH
jgi:MarR family transcriptional regulator, negative regulator of the multidrug operon emrRAB